MQALELRSTSSPNAETLEILETLIALVRRPVRRELDRLLAPGSDRTRIWRQLRLVKLLYGECNLKETTGGDGDRHAKFRLAAGSADLELEMTTDGGKLRSLCFSRLDPTESPRD